MNILLSDEKMFDIDGVYNSHNDRIWTVNRAGNVVLGRKRKCPQKVLVWLEVCSEGVSPLVIFENDTLDHDWYIKEVLPVALKYGNDIFWDDWIFQQELHVHEKSQESCANSFPSFIDKDYWPPNSPNLNLLDFCI